MTMMFGRRGPEIDARATGKRIQEIRRKKGLRVTDISDYMGFYEPQAVYKWLRGDSLPTLQNMFQLSQLFETTIDDIIRCTDDEERGPAGHTGMQKREGDERSSSLSFLSFAYILGFF